MNISLNEKVVVVTGSSRGLGREMIMAFAKEGANVVINYKEDQKSADTLYDEVKHYASCISVKADVTKEDEVCHLYHSVINRFGKVLIFEPLVEVKALNNIFCGKVWLEFHLYGH